MNENNEQDTIDELETDDDADVTIYEQKIDKRRKQSNIPHIPETFLNFTRYVQRWQKEIIFYQWHEDQ